MKEEAGEKLSDKVYSREEYAKADFWDDRYAQNGGFFDWYAQFPELRKSFEQQYGLSKDDKILIVGCGNSKLSQQMYEAGYKNIINIDISPSVIAQMTEKFPHMIWEVMDGTNMTYKDHTFDCIIDKGTLDALIAGKNFEICYDLMKQCMRVTKESGQLILITYGSPEGRKKIFQNALPFDQFDYHACTANLSDMSTMINLMRGNVPNGKLGDIIKNPEQFKATMKEFAIIKMLRKTKKYQKKYIVWKNFTNKSKIELQNNYQENQPSSSEQKSKNEQKKQIQKLEENKQVKQQQNSGKIETKHEQKKSFTYEPKKQSFVYVYSITRKLTNGFNEIISLFTDQVINDSFKNEIQGATDFQHFTIKGEETALILAKQALKFLLERKISNSPVLLSSDWNESPVKNSKILNIIPTECLQKITILRKSNINVKLSLKHLKGDFSHDLQKLLSKINKIGSFLLQECDLHPCPKTYALFYVFKTRCNQKNVNQLLKKYWHATAKIDQINEDQIKIILSVPPVNQIKFTQIVSALQNYFKPYNIKVNETKHGFITYPDLQLLNILSNALIRNSGDEKIENFEDFWIEDDLSRWIQKVNPLKQNLYRELDNTITAPSNMLARILSHVLSLY